MYILFPEVERERNVEALLAAVVRVVRGSDSNLKV